MRISKSGANLREQGALVNSAGLVVVLAVQNKKVACTHDNQSRLISKYDISRCKWTPVPPNSNRHPHASLNAPPVLDIQYRKQRATTPSARLAGLCQVHGCHQAARSELHTWTPQAVESVPPLNTKGRGFATSSRENARHKTKECRCGQREALRTYFSSAALRRPCSRRRMA